MRSTSSSGCIGSQGKIWRVALLTCKLRKSDRETNKGKENTNPTFFYHYCKQTEKIQITSWLLCVSMKVGIILMTACNQMVPFSSLSKTEIYVLDA